MRDLRYLNSHRINLKEFKKFEYDETKEGFFDIFIDGKGYFVIASYGEGWQHVSVSGHNDMMPSWDVMETIKNKFFNDDEFVVEYHPKKEEYVNNRENCLHMWSPLGANLPYPDLNEIRKSKPQVVAKKPVRINNLGYYYEHFKSDAFEYVVVRSFNGCPDWEALCEIKQQVFGNEVAVSYHAKKGDLLYKHNKKNPNIVTIWMPTKENIVTPDSILVGIKGLSEEDLDNMSREEIAELM